MSENRENGVRVFFKLSIPLKTEHISDFSRLYDQTKRSNTVTALGTVSPEFLHK